MDYEELFETENPSFEVEISSSDIAIAKDTGNESFLDPQTGKIIVKESPSNETHFLLTETIESQTQALYTTKSNSNPTAVFNIEIKRPTDQNLLETNSINNIEIIQNENYTVVAKSPIAKINMENINNESIGNNYTESDMAVACLLEDEKNLSESRPTESLKRKIQEETLLTDAELTCTICQIIFTKLKYLKLHKKLIHNYFNGVCPVPKCKKNFVLRETMRKHIQNDHKDAEEFNCRDCKQVTITFDKFEEHEAIHLRPLNEIKLYKSKMCEYCSKMVSSSHLAKHIKQVHKGYGKKVKKEI